MAAADTEKAIRRHADGSIEVDAELVAPALGLSAAELKQEMRRGRVFQIVEHGHDEDAGRIRVTFRHRSREARLIVTNSGKMVGWDLPSDHGK